jgi:hypothetical protein
MTRSLFAFVLLFISQNLLAQDDLLNELEKDDQSKKEVIGTFHGTRLVNGHSVETKHRGELEFIITHRFGKLNSGAYELFGLDNSAIRIGLEYGITDKLGVGAGRSSDIKTLDYYVKYKLLQQQEHGTPVTITALGAAAYNGLQNHDYPSLTTADNMSYVAQVLIARKFSSRVSFQVMPAYLHRNTVNKDTVNNNLFSVGVGGRAKLTKSMAIVGEYYLRTNEMKDNPFNDSVGLGVEFETGGHVFQLVFSNSRGMVERAFLAETDGDFFDGNIHFGFNITRTFQLAKNK